LYHPTLAAGDDAPADEVEVAAGALAEGDDGDPRCRRRAIAGAGVVGDMASNFSSVSSGS